MATRSSVLAWRIPGTGEPGGLPSMGSHRIGHDWSHLAAAADDKESTCNARDPVRSLYQEDPLEKGMATHSNILAWRIPWTEEPGSYSPWGQKVSDTTEQLSTAQHSTDCSLPGSSDYRISQARILGVGCHFLLWDIFLDQRSNPGLLHWQVCSLPLSHQSKPMWTVVDLILD